MGGATNVGGGGTGGQQIAQCQAQVYQCGDLLDNDGDGLVDNQDPDCLGPCDNTEDSFFGGIPGQAGPACGVDCYFDSNSGSGNDDCNWTHQCDPNSVAPNYYPEPANGSACEYNPNASPPGAGGQDCAALDAMQSQACHDFCGPLTPNGCDCFGCCELPAQSGKYVWLGSEGPDAQNPTACTFDKLDDPAFCHPCKPVAACLNDCGPCEICLGKPLPDPDCFGGGTGGGSSTGSGATTGSGTSSGAGGGGSTGQCDPGIQACGLPNQPPCPLGFYCITGCCQANPN